MDVKRPILVTGSHRSGTTWVGRMIAISPSVYYIHEPFNPTTKGIFNAQVDFWFTYISEINEPDYYKNIKRVIEFRYAFLSRLKAVNMNRKNVMREMKDYFSLLGCRIKRRRPLLKDPIAIFSAEWLAARFNMDVIVLIRHPAAFAGSLKTKNWKFPFSHFLKQSALMKDYLSEFEAEIRKFTNEEHDIIDQAALLWNLIHSTISNYRKKYSNWFFIRHEDLSNQPERYFRELFKNLNLNYSEKIADVIRWHSSIADFKNHKNELYFSALRRDSASSLTSWKNRLTSAEIERVKDQVWDISKEFYSERDWKM